MQFAICKDNYFLLESLWKHNTAKCQSKKLQPLIRPSIWFGTASKTSTKSTKSNTHQNPNRPSGHTWTKIMSIIPLEPCTVHSWVMRSAHFLSLIITSLLRSLNKVIILLFSHVNARRRSFSLSQTWPVHWRLLNGLSYAYCPRYIWSLQIAWLTIIINHH